MQPSNKNLPEPDNEEEVFDWRLARIILPILLIAPFIMTGLITAVSGELATFNQMILPVIGVVYGGTLVYILYLWISKPIRDLSDKNKEKLLKLTAEIIAKIIILFIIAFIGWFVYMIVTGQ